MSDYPSAIVQIMTDAGGALGEHIALADYFQRAGIRVEIKGMCGSSCLWLLTLPKEQFCSYPHAWIGEHSAIGQLGDQIIWTREQQLIDKGYSKC